MSVDQEHPGMRRTRREVRAKASIVAGEQRWEVAVHDLSLSGARSKMPAGFALAAGTPVVMTLEAGFEGLTRVEGRVARINGDELAIGFEHIGVAESEALQRFIEHNGRMLDAIDRL